MDTIEVMQRFDSVREHLTERLAINLAEAISAMGARANTDLTWFADYRVQAIPERMAA